jgi:hypothetical protein
METLPRDEDAGSFGESEEAATTNSGEQGPVAERLGDEVARERAPGFVMALRTCVRTVSSGMCSSSASSASVCATGWTAYRELRRTAPASAVAFLRSVNARTTVPQ